MSSSPGTHQKPQHPETTTASAGTLRFSEFSKDPKQLAAILTKSGNYSQKHVRDAALADDKKPSATFLGLGASKSFTKVPLPFCNEPPLRAKLARAVHWHQDLLRAMLAASRDDATFAPLVRCHLRGVRYGVSRQVQQYVERLGVLCSRDGGKPPAAGSGTAVCVEGLYRWLQTYSRLWMLDFQVRAARALLLAAQRCDQKHAAAGAPGPRCTRRKRQIEAGEAHCRVSALSPYPFLVRTAVRRPASKRGRVACLFTTKG